MSGVESGRGLGFLCASVGACAAVLGGAPAAHAIPSPELVIGSVSSLSQLGALLAATLGGGALAFGARKGGARALSRTMVRLAWAGLALGIVLAALNIYQFTETRHTERERLQSTLLRPSVLPGSQVLDPTLRQISFKDQVNHPLGVSTGDAAAALSGGRTLFLDVREGGEFETGSLPGAKHVRFPDLAGSGLDLTGKQVVLFCHNGNRSFETCERLAAMGIDCRFIRGGIEKWIVEGRAFTDPKVRTLSDLRSLPGYPGSSVLLDTAAAKRLINEDKAAIVDVRYPGEFAVHHLPGAVNIPIRMLSSDELARRISELPAGPVFAACYDRRSCFSSQVLGLELSRAGREFRGRYTLPWEYYEPKPQKPHVAAWLAEQQKGLWQRGIDGLARLIGALSDHTGLLAAILLVALCSRLLVLPVALKAERDQLVMRAHGRDLADMKTQHRDNPRRRAEAMKSFYATHGLTPLRNLAALAFLPVMMLTLSAIEQTAGRQGGAVAWIADAGVPDPYLVLPLIFGVLAGIYLDLVFADSRRKRLVIWLAAAPFLAWLAAIVSASGALYLVASIMLLLAQRAWVTRSPAWLFALPYALRRSWRMRGLPDGVIPLDCARDLAGCGNKAERLGTLTANGIAVPRGYVLSRQYLDELDCCAPQTRIARLGNLFRQLNLGKAAVRSSAAGEDGVQHSFAGVYESVLNVTADDFADAVSAVQGSFASARAASYEADGGSGNILVQRMVDAEYSGVLFTLDPASPGAMLLEMVDGIAEQLVSGLATPQSFRFGRGSSALLGSAQPAIDVTPLLDMARTCERLFDAAQDIEWVYRDGAFMIVQTRDITVHDHGLPKLQAGEWRKLAGLAGDGAGDAVVLEQDGMTEVLPQPTPFSLGLMQALWAGEGSVELACQAMGLRYNAGPDGGHRLVTVFGRLYTNRLVEQRQAVRMSRAAVRRLTRRPGQIADDFEHDFAPDFRDRMAILEATEFARLDAARLIATARQMLDDFTTETHVRVEMINIAASFHLTAACEALKAAGRDPAQCLGGEFDNDPLHALAAATSLPGSERRPAMIAAAGHRAVFDYELAEPRYGEDIAALEAHAEAYANITTIKTCRGAAHGGIAELPLRIAEMVETARRYQHLKEVAKDLSLRQLAVLRRILLAIDTAYALDDGVFHLLPDEVCRLPECNGAELRGLISTRRREREELLKVPALPSRLTRARIEVGAVPQTRPTADCEDGIIGQRVAGTGVVFGRARVLDAASCELGLEIEDLRDGDIIVCKMVHPAWLGEVLRSGGVVSEVGGWLSHMAIVAREHGVAMICGAAGIESIPDGAYVRLAPDGSVTVLDTNADDIPDASSVAMTG